MRSCGHKGADLSRPELQGTQKLDQYSVMSYVLYVKQKKLRCTGGSPLLSVTRSALAYTLWSFWPHPLYFTSATFDCHAISPTLNCLLSIPLHSELDSLASWPSVIKLFICEKESIHWHSYKQKAEAVCFVQQQCQASFDLEEKVLHWNDIHNVKLAYWALQKDLMGPTRAKTLSLHLPSICSTLGLFSQMKTLYCLCF